MCPAVSPGIPFCKLQPLNPQSTGWLGARVDHSNLDNLEPSHKRWIHLDSDKHYKKLIGNISHECLQKMKDKKLNIWSIGVQTSQCNNGIRL